MKMLNEDIVNIDLRRNIYFFVYITFPSIIKKGNLSEIKHSIKRINKINLHL